MRPIFYDPILQKQFDKEGYVRVPFISKEKVEKLIKLYFETLPQSGGTIASEDVDMAKKLDITYDFTFIDRSPDYKKIVFEIISKEFLEGFEKYLVNYKPIIANYIRKKTEMGGTVPLHQNWAFVEERKHTSITIWCPLVDSNRENGTLEVVPASNKRFAEFRGPMIPWELEGIKDTIIKDYLVALDTPAGDAVIIDDSIIHYTRPNKTPNLRLAIQLILIPAEVPSVHYNFDPTKPKEINVLEVDHEFYMQFNPWMKPENVKKIATLPYTPRSLSVAEFKTDLQKPRFDIPAKGLLTKLRRLLTSN